MKPIVLFAVALISFKAIIAQQPDEAAAKYTKVITERAAKIVTPLGISDSEKATQVQAIIVQQYRDLNEVHDGRSEKIKSLKEQAGKGNKPDENAVKSLDVDADKQLKQLHQTYISKLSTLLSPEQVDQVKDGMTYNVFHVTYTAYEDMIPTLTDTQKGKIYSWLLEAREQAMDQGSSEDKHKVFGKYKGRINNYLSSEGYDLKKEEKGWQERLRKKREQQKS
jgi:hypothetical protein